MIAAATRPFGPPRRRKLSVTDSARKTTSLVAEKLGISYHKPGVRLNDRPLPHPAIRGLVMRRVTHHHSYVTRVGEATLTVRAADGRYLIERRGTRECITRSFDTPREAMLFLNAGRIAALMGRPPLMLPAPRAETLVALELEKTRREERLKRIARVGNKVLASKKTIPASTTVMVLPPSVTAVNFNILHPPSIPESARADMERLTRERAQRKLSKVCDDIAQYESCAARCGGWLEEDIASIFGDHKASPTKYESYAPTSASPSNETNPGNGVKAGELFESVKKALASWNSQTNKVQLAGGYYLKANGTCWINLRHPRLILAECVAIQKGKAGDWEMLTTPQAVRDYMIKVRDGEQPVKHPALQSLNSGVTAKSNPLEVAL